MYYRHFHLTGPPFEAAGDPNALYLSRAHRESLAALEWGLLYEPSGFTTLTGETGTGKTTLVCSILARNFAQLCAAYVINPKLSFEDILRVILGQFGAPCTGGTKLDRIEALVGFLGRRMKHERLAIIVDEAQDLSDDVLEELRLLSNYGQRIGRHLQLVLIAQPELGVRLRHPALRQFNQRIAARSVLTRMSFAEAHEYAEYRLRAQGGRSQDIFDSDALALLLRRSNGIPRQINVLCHNAMLLAYSSGAPRVTLKAARTAVAEHYHALSDGFWPLTNPLKWRMSSLAGAALGLILFGGYIYESCPTDAPQYRVQTVAANPAREAKATVEAITKEAIADAATSASFAASASHPTSRVRPSVTTRHLPEPSASNKAVTPSDDTAAIVLPSLLPAGWSLHYEQSAVTQLPQTARLAESDMDPRPNVLVKYGDTLERIAQRYLGSPDALNILIEANPQITDINRIYPGQKIYLSVPVATDTSAPATVGSRRSTL